MLIRCPSCRCEIKRKEIISLGNSVNKGTFERLTSKFEKIPIQETIVCYRCNTNFMILEWKEKQ